MKHFNISVENICKKFKFSVKFDFLKFPSAKVYFFIGGYWHQICSFRMDG